MGMLLQTSKERVGIKYLHHLIPVQLVGPVLVDHGVPAPEDPALAEPLDEDALLVAVQQDPPLQVPKELLGDLLLAVILDGISRGEPHVLQGIRGIELLPMAGGLAEREPAALAARRGDAPHQPPAVEEADHHLRIAWGMMGVENTIRGRQTLPALHCNAHTLREQLNFTGASLT